MTYCDNQIQATQHRKIVFQPQQDIYQTQLHRLQDQILDLNSNCHVSRTNDPGKDNTIMIIEKNANPEEISLLCHEDERTVCYQKKMIYSTAFTLKIHRRGAR